MKNNIFKLIILVASLLFVLSGCQTPEDLTPSVSRDGINSITASFLDDESSENSFTSEIDYDNGVITMVFPYNYPTKSQNILNLEDLTHMRVQANLDDNVNISPAILYMDFTKDIYLTVTDQMKNKKEYKVLAQIRKNAENSITEFELISSGLAGVVNEGEKTISIISIEDIEPTLAKVSLSHGATMSPDPRKEKLDYNNDVKITVTAQNGTSISVYTVKKAIPQKVDLGMRPGSAKILWAKKLQSDLGITSLHITNSIAATQDHLVINTRGETSMYLNSKTGEIEGRLKMDGIVSPNINFFNTADDDDNILISNLSPEAGSLKIWKIKDVNSTPELYLEYNGGQSVGRKFSIQGSIDKDAIITAPIAHIDTGNYFLRWQVKNGVLVSSTPDKIEVKIADSRWRDNCDIVYSNPSDLQSDYFISYYGAPYKMAWVDGKTNTSKAWGPEISGNWLPNAIDYKVFNNNPYVVHTTANSFTWGSDDTVLLFDASSTNTISAPIWRAPIGTYGGNNNGGHNAWGTADVALKVSESGYYMYLYFLFTNGQVVCMQFDCIKM